MNEKQEQILALIKKKKECDKRALEIVHKLIEPEVDPTFLLSQVFNLMNYSFHLCSISYVTFDSLNNRSLHFLQALYIGPPHLEDVVEERRLAGLCGWTLCSKSLDPEVSKKKQRYVIRGRKVLDITDRKVLFCIYFAC